jgi:hypothetical protein
MAEFALSKLKKQNRHYARPNRTNLRYRLPKKRGVLFLEYHKVDSGDMFSELG